MVFCFVLSWLELLKQISLQRDQKCTRKQARIYIVDDLFCPCFFLNKDITYTLFFSGWTRIREEMYITTPISTFQDNLYIQSTHAHVNIQKTHPLKKKPPRFNYRAAIPVRRAVLLFWLQIFEPLAMLTAFSNDQAQLFPPNTCWSTQFLQRSNSCLDS